MRTFKLIIEGKVKGKSKMVSLPCNGESPYTGCDALEVMRMYQKRRPKVRVNAITQNSQMENGWEALTLKEMEDVFGEETDARKPWERRLR